MLFIKTATENKVEKTNIDGSESCSVVYHSIFDYPLTEEELGNSRAGDRVENLAQASISYTGGYYHLSGKNGLITKRKMREKISAKKEMSARQAASLLEKIPSVKFVGITGALAMNNAADSADIDLMIISSKGTLWLTRLISLLGLSLFGFKLRRFGNRDEKDKLCLNIWLDEDTLTWKKRNIYTAHEIAQIKPLVNKNGTFERLIAKNKWTSDYWPNAVRGMNYEQRITNNGKGIIHNSSFMIQLFERVAFFIQYQYMKSKITNEVVTPTRALFHPVDWSKYILQKLTS
ncbi:hypothetical protein M1545_03545 [Patescibacteria group bacterium]|nr:hypothetical protein [Patescibacteria group bacterium]